MKRFDGSSPLPADYRGGVIALGNFDGFHLGHQAVVGVAVSRARAAGVPAVVATFDPHPVRYFHPEAEPFRLTSLEQRARLFAAAGADAMLVFDVNAELVKTSAEDFITGWLIGLAGASAVVTGEDFTFGRGRAGTIATLAAHPELHAIAVPPLADHIGVISSSRVRDALQAGDCATATRLLTRPFSIEGEVEHGARLGRTIGYPTANLKIGRYLRPKYGIYAVTGHLPDGRTLQGAANLGIRPTFDPPVELLEPYFFDFNEYLYGEQIEVVLHAYLRPEAKFDSLDALKAQMAKDCDAAREALSALP
ncbi:MAG: bifunctional riboflavin kinase/FAD synthetase [Alphaproteobacteria bacterium]|nr:bifunctional riboflavin kinase/FAD synthetase [Alphaproteobacteria bacterium]MDE2041471.1 bifunctional riboflavin kinase/FAD synthetase [Alphaproteobacteria bacterium]MDE2340948.1 bifunctional riboflavin kinase/FAD synthetase [Alphaproteobacteria bacterium]